MIGGVVARAKLERQVSLLWNGQVNNRNRTQVQETTVRKAYSAPTLVVKGEVVGVTQVNKSGDGDMIFPETGLGTAAGNVGFQL